MEDTTITLGQGDERTRLAEPIVCPVCSEQNVAGGIWCASCGFRLDAAPGPAVEPAPRYALVGENQRHALKPGPNVVGRLNADVFLSDPSVSRRHAVVTVGEGGVSVRDDNSSNGTRMNDVRLPPGDESPLLPGETVRFGAVELRLEAPEGAEVPVPPTQAPRHEPPPPAPVAFLSDAENWHPLREGVNTVGRRSDNDVVLSEPTVSGRHALIVLSGGSAELSDSGSTNGTWWNEERLEPGAKAALTDGDTIRFGRASLGFGFTPATGADEGAGPEEEEPPSEADAG